MGVSNFEINDKSFLYLNSFELSVCVKRFFQNASLSPKNLKFFRNFRKVCNTTPLIYDEKFQSPGKTIERSQK